MDQFSVAALEQFIIQAKRNTYAGNGRTLLPYRLGSKDLQFVEGDWTYHDSYLGEWDFIGQEIVYFRMKPVWGMNYFGVILQPDKITAPQAGQMIKESLSLLYTEGRFLGGFEHSAGPFTYIDENEGDVASFRGKERILRDSEVVYELVYHGGLLRDE